MLDLVNCKVLSTVESEKVDAYLLSESSMFVFPHKIILKTCGTTTLLCGLPRILEIAATSAGFPHIVANDRLGTATAAHTYRVFYSRKNFLFPDRQRGPHRSWRDEVRSLDRLLPGAGGSAYVIGKLNGEHWYLYITEPNVLLTPPPTPDRCEKKIETLDVPAYKLSMSENEDDDDETLEILMTDLDPENAKQFSIQHATEVAEGKFYDRAHEASLDAQQHLGSLANLPTRTTEPPKSSAKHAVEEVDIFSNSSASDPCEVMSADYEQFNYPAELATEGHSLGTVVSEACGLADVYPVSKYPDARIDAYLFKPCGFSANGVIPAPDGPQVTHYFTVHVTPEPECSYASFETNVPHKQTGRKTADIIDQVVNIFKPGRFTVTLFEGKKTPVDYDDEGFTSNKPTARKDCRWENIRGYRRLDRIVHNLDGYDLVFKSFEKIDWEGDEKPEPRIGEKDF